MPYINNDGTISGKRTIYRVSIIGDIFWGIIDFIHIFIITLVDPKRPIKKRYDKDKDKPYGRINNSSSNGGDGPDGRGPPRRRYTDVSTMREEAAACSSGS